MPARRTSARPSKTKWLTRLVFGFAFSLSFSPMISFASRLDFAILLQLFLDSFSLSQTFVPIGLKLRLSFAIITVMMSRFDLLPTRHHLQDRCLRRNGWFSFAPSCDPRRCRNVNTLLPVSTIFNYLLKDAAPRSGRIPTRGHLPAHTGLRNHLASEPFKLFCSSSVIGLVYETPRPRPLHHQFFNVPFIALQRCQGHYLLHECRTLHYPPRR